MDKIKLLKERRADQLAKSESIRSDIQSLCDKDSFVELGAFSFSKNEFFGEECGEGVVTGFFTIQGYPFYVVAQDFSVYSGGMSKANCEKIAKTLNAAEKNETPVVYLLHTQGVQVGEGVNVLEGLAELLLKATQLKGTVAQYAVVNGEVYGTMSAFSALCDVTFFLDKSALCIGSPLVLTAGDGKNEKKEEVGGYKSLSATALPFVAVKSLEEVGETIVKITELINIPVVDAELNETAPELNKKVTAKGIASLIENGVEIGANTASEVKTIVGRIGGISVAALVFDGSVKLNALNMKKIKNFTEFACCFGFPFVTFVDCVGLEMTKANNNSSVLREITEYLSVLDATDTAKIAVVTGKAVGLGYTLFAAKSIGFDYTYALANSEIALFESEKGAEIEFASEKVDADKLAKRYATEYADPFNAAKNGYLDNIVEPQFVKQYLIASLQMLIK